MPTSKKTSKGKTKTKARAKASKAIAKAKPKAMAAKAKATARPRKAPVKSKAKAATKAKAAPKSKARPATKASPKAKAAPKVTALAKTKARSTANQARKLPPRRDASGRLDPQYARDLRALSRENQEDKDDRAFFKTPHSGDDLAEELGEEAVEKMTSGEDQGEHLIGAEVEEERGGPFVKTRAAEEFAGGTDRSNPRDATREPFPRT